MTSIRRCTRRRGTPHAVAAVAALLATLTPAQSTHAQTASRTQLIILGSGTPIPDPDRSGPAVAIVVDSVAYLFDAGAGVMRRVAAAERTGVVALQAARIGTLFITHLHSDHTMGLNDVMFAPGIRGRKPLLALYGPPGTQRLITGILDAYSEDIVERQAAPGGPAPGTTGATVHEIAEGEIFSDARVSIRAFLVPHAGWKYAFGYRIRTPDKVIVISGDTRASSAIARECNGCDILLHEVYSDTGFTTLNPVRQSYFAHAHTSATQLGDIATQARPGLLVLYHQLFFGASDSTLLAEVRSRFSGRVVSAKDLDKF